MVRGRFLCSSLFTVCDFAWKGEICSPRKLSYSDNCSRCFRYPATVEHFLLFNIVSVEILLKMVAGEGRYRLLYFNIKARGELIRLLFHAVGQEFEDDRLTAANWSTVKQETPFNSLPVLEANGKHIAQSMAIARFLAQELGLAGESSYENALMDSVAETADDLLADYLNLTIGDTKQHVTALRKRFLEETLPVALRNFDRFQRDHRGGYGYIVGNKLSYADLAVYNVLDQLVGSGTINASYLQSYKYVGELRKRILSHGRLMKYFNTRPVTKV